MLQDIFLHVLKKEWKEVRQKAPPPPPDPTGQAVLDTQSLLFPDCNLELWPSCWWFQSSKSEREAEGVQGLSYMRCCADSFGQFDGEARKLLVVQHPRKGCLAWPCSMARQSPHSHSDHCGFCGPQPLNGWSLPFTKLTKVIFMWK